MSPGNEVSDARFSAFPLPLASMSLDGTILAVNDALLRMSGYRREDLVGKSGLDFFSAGELSDVVQGWSRLLSGEIPSRRADRELPRANGDLLDVRVESYVVRSPDGSPLRIEVVVLDLTAHRLLEQELRAGEARWQSLALRASDVALLVDADTVIRFATPSLEHHFGYAPEDVLGTAGYAFFHPDDAQVAQDAMARVLRLPGQPQTIRGRVRHADGRWRWIEETITNLLHDPDVQAVVCNLTDITSLLEAQQQVRADTDPLTGLLGRTSLLEQVQRLALAADTGRLGLLVVDLDNFRGVNAAVGHELGDHVLVACAERLRGALTDRHWAGALGGDHFAVVTDDLPGDPDLSLLARRVRDSLVAPLELPGGGGLALTATVGGVQLAVGARHGDLRSGDLLETAEEAVRRARRSGPGQVLVEHQVRPRGRGSAALLARLGRAARRDELSLHYQPVVDLLSGRCAGAEGLLRWEDPERGLVLPADFLAVAEAGGVLVGLVPTLLEQACRAALRWAGYGTPAEPFAVHVNLSAAQMSDGSLVDLVRTALRTTGASPQSLILEVTETAVMHDVATAVRVMGELRDVGVGLGVDDFGTGWSTLSSLRDFPFTGLKIDRSFVSGLIDDGDDRAIVASVLSLAGSLGLTAVAEGVETEEHCVALRDMGCRRAQGWLWSAALPADELDAWLRDLRPQAVEPARARRRPRTPSVEAVPEESWSRIAALQADGASLQTITSALNGEGLLRTDGRRWHVRAVARVIADRADA